MGRPIQWKVFSHRVITTAFCKFIPEEKFDTIVGGMIVVQIDAKLRGRVGPRLKATDYIRLRATSDDEKK